MNKFQRLQLVTTLLVVSSAQAQEQRHIHLNGEHLTNTGISLLDKVSGNIVNNGNYWLNLQTGQWGHEGNEQVMGVLTIVANQAAQQNSVPPTQQRQQNNRTIINNSQNGSVVSGNIDGKRCTYVTVAGTSMRSCD